MADSDVSESSSSSSSDDDFLTLGAGKGGETLDREALVRKKLLESFYGREAVADAVPTNSMDDYDDGDDDDDDDDDESPFKVPGSGHLQHSTDDLDSPAFDAEAHTRHHVKHSSMQSLLDTEEKLTLSVRTLDTEMQSLVYENYTRFIDATDAIRSIGVNVKANEDGLDRLSTGMGSIDENSRKIEESLGSLRDQVAEKIRIKRLLTRLDTLLNLPQTLRDQIANGDCRSACKQFLQASSILSKHSEGFESLKSIETECNSILQDLKLDLNMKLNFWSGQAAVDDNDQEPAPPTNVRDVFECSGTLYLLCKEGGQQLDHISHELQQKSLAACMRLLDRVLDTHMIEIQERRYSIADMEPSFSDTTLGASANSIRASIDADSASLIASDVLVGILEVARLWPTCFDDKVAGNAEIVEFVSEVFASFLVHERAILLEESFQDDNQDPDDGEASAEMGVSGALILLVRGVEGLAHGLAQPDISISSVYANNLVEQARMLSDALVRRRVDRKFMRLRFNIAEDCLLPFVQRALQEITDSDAADKPAHDGMVQIANATLSDCLQLVDDTIRSIISLENGGTSLTASEDMLMVKRAVQASSIRFMVWLANAFEMLAGGESCDPMRIVDVKANEWQGTCMVVNEENVEREQLSPTDEMDAAMIDTRSVSSLIDKAYKGILAAGGLEVDSIHPKFILAVGETCRMAQSSMPDMLEQSMTARLGGHKKKSKGMFEDGKSTDGEYIAVAHRFQVAWSRLLVLYSSNRGTLVGDGLLEGLTSLDACTSVGAPREYVLNALHLVKEAAITCSRAFGVHSYAGPIPAVRQNGFSVLSSAARTARKSGLHLDVERMFKEKVTIFPHPSTIIAQHPCDVIFIILKVAFRALLEAVRSCIVSGPAYRQLLVELDFLKLMVPHYIKSDFSVGGDNACASLTNLLSDVLLAAGERCLDMETLDDGQVQRQSADILTRFMAAREKNGVADRIVIQQVEAA